MKETCGCVHDGTQILILCSSHADGGPRKKIEDQPPPRPASGDMWELVIDDMKQRRLVGIERYGTPLQMHNGRNALIDAYQEVLDLAVYLRQKIEEDR